MGFIFASIFPAPQPQRLLVSGSATMAPLLQAIADKYRRLHPEVAVDVVMGGSGRGLADVREGKAQIAMVSRALGINERELYGIPIARDGVGVLVHAENPLYELGDDHLRAIFTGRVENWRAVGGADAPIRLVGAPPCGSASVMLAQYLKQSPETFQSEQRISANVERMAAVAADRHAVTYLSVGAGERAMAGGAAVRLLPIAGVAANSTNIRNGNYPISRALTLACKETPYGAARSFFAFCLSSQVNSILAAYDFVPYLD